jgi:hypothetical protein
VAALPTVNDNLDRLTAETSLRHFAKLGKERIGVHLAGILTERIAMSCRCEESYVVSTTNALLRTVVPRAAVVVV